MSLKVYNRMTTEGFVAAPLAVSPAGPSPGLPEYRPGLDHGPEGGTGRRKAEEEVARCPGSVSRICQDGLEGLGS